MSDVQQVASARWESLAGRNGAEHFAAKGVCRMLVVVARSHCESADQLEILGKGDIAFDDACPLFCGGDVSLSAVFRIAQRCASVSDGEVRGVKVRRCAALQSLFERCVGQSLAQRQCSPRGVDGRVH